MLRNLLPWMLAVAGLGAASWITIDQKRLAAEAGRMRVELDEARLAVEASREVAASSARTLRAVEDERVRLEIELAGAVGKVEALGKALEERAAAELAARKAEEVRRAARAVVPEGVRVALLALRDCLRADGFAGLRFLSASAIEDQELRDVEVLDSEAGEFESALFLARRMRVELDRSKASVVLRFFEGHRRSGAERTDFPAEGLALEFRPVTPRLWEERLPYLLRATGVAADGAAGVVAPAPAPSTDPRTRAMWLERCNALLDASAAETRYRLGELADLKDGRFVGVSLRGYDAANRLQATIDADTLWIEIDEAAGIVQLVLAGGSLRTPGGVSAIAEEGMRLLLRDVTPKAASDAMLGMVVRR
ncbi:MAG: hypothetical protein RL148_1166 [Planctomycetota bacterium]|jgi:hypothetical protein